MIVDGNVMDMFNNRLTENHMKLNIGLNVNTQSLKDRKVDPTK